MGCNAALPVAMQDGAEQIVFRGMVSPSQRVAILSNWGPKHTAIVSFAGDFRHVVEARSGAELKRRQERGRTLVDVGVEAGAVAVVIAE